MDGEIEESRKRPQKGFTLIELVVVSGVLLIMVMIGLPQFTGMVLNSRLDASARQIAGDMRDARSLATKNGWQYQIVGYNAGGSTTYKNQYRLAGRANNTVAWPTPVANGSSFQSSTQMAGEWINFNSLYQGISLNPANTAPSFYVSFDSQGAVFESTLPLTITLQSGGSRQVSVSLAGNVKIQ